MPEVPVKRSRIRPAPGFILLIPDEPVEKTKSGLILPDAVAKDQSAGRGEVIAVGAERVSSHGAKMPMPVRVGQRILFQRAAGPRFEFADGVARLLDVNDILAIVES